MKAYISACITACALAFEEVQIPEASGWSKLTIKENGKNLDLYVAMGTSKSSGTTLDIPYNNRGYLSRSASLDPNKYYKPNLMGGSVEYDVDLSQQNCGCVAAFYLVGMPGKNSAG